MEEGTPQIRQKFFAKNILRKAAIFNPKTLFSAFYTIYF